MKLYFHDNWDKMRPMGEFENVESARAALPKIVASINPDYKIYYIRTYFVNESTIFDVGSHCEDFILREE